MWTAPGAQAPAQVAVTGTTETVMTHKNKTAPMPKMGKDDMGEHKMAKDK